MNIENVTVKEVVNNAVNKGTIWQSLLEAQKSIIAIEKKSINQAANYSYKYTSCEDMIDHCRTALHDHGLVLLTTGSELINDASGPICSVSYQLIHIMTGDKADFVFPMPVVIGRAMPLDKAYCSSLSTNLAYFLRNLLLVKRGDEKPIDARDDSHFEPEVNNEPHYKTNTKTLSNDDRAQVLQAKINDAQSRDELKRIFQECAKLPKPYKEALTEMCQKKAESFKGAA